MGLSGPLFALFRRPQKRRPTDPGPDAPSDPKRPEPLALDDAFVESLPGIFYVLDFEGRFRRWNHRFEKETGYSAAELAELNALDLFEGPDQAAVAEGIQRVADDGEATVQATLTTKEGTGKDFLFTGRLIESAGEPRLAGLGIDISARLRAERLSREADERFRQLIEESPVPQAYVNAEGEIVYRNEAFRELFGWDRDDAPTLAEWWDLAYPDPDYQARVRETWDEAVGKAAENDAPIEPIEYRVRCKDGQERTVEVGGAILGDALLATFSDVTERRRVAEALEESKAQFEGLYNSVPVSIWDEDWSEVIALVDALPHDEIDDYREYFDAHPDLVAACLQRVRITDVNPATLTIFEADSKEQMLESLEVVFNTPDTLPGFVGELVALAAGESTYRTEMDLNTVRGEVITVFLSMTFPGKWDTSGRVIVSLMDISELQEAREQLAQSEAMFRTIFEKSSIGKTLTAPDGTLLRVNGAFAEMLGYTVEELKEANWAELTHQDDVAESTELVRTLLAGDQDEFRLEKRYIHRSGRIVWTALSTHLLRDEEGEPVFFITSVLDITDRKDAERALERSNQELQQFAYVASHDLQEPLRMVASYTQLLAERYEGALDERADKYIRYAVDGARRMQRLINDLLKLSRVGTRGEPFRPVEAGEIVQSVMQDLGRAIRESDAQIDVDELPVVVADPGQLAQVFQNGIQNAIKYAGDGPPRITIAARSDERTHHFTIADRGIGIDPQYHDQVFEIFKRLHERDEQAGSGIGLAIVRKIIQRHGGRSWVESTGEGGTTLHFTLPTTIRHGGGNGEQDQDPAG